MGSSSHLYSLSWGEFSSSLASAVQLLRGHGDLVDVTLAAGGRSFPAHKIVLSAASPFLLDLLKSTPCQHPIVMLAGINSDDLESLLEFIYRGEVNIEQNQLPSLLQAAHCLSIHGLSPPTILTENGEEVPASAIPTSEPVTREIMNSSIPIHRRKKRRKSSSSSTNKWPKMDSTAVDQDDRQYQEEEKVAEGEGKNEDNGVSTEEVNEQSEASNQRGGSEWQGATHQSSSLILTDVHQPQQEALDTKSNLQTLMAMQQQYSPLHIPSFPGSLNMAIPPGYPLIQGPPPTTTTTTTSSSTIKVRGASDCPGICPLCGATLRQARNLRRHLLSSCKYRLNSFPTLQQPSEQMVVEIKPEIDLNSFSSHNHTTDSRESTNSEQIICHPASPSNTNVVSPHNNISETIAR